MVEQIGARKRNARALVGVCCSTVIVPASQRGNGNRGELARPSDRLGSETYMTDQAIDTPNAPEAPEVRPAIDADDIAKLKRNPSDEDAKLDVAVDETFPASDAPSNTQPGKGKDPAPSSGYDPQAEAERAGRH